jgi:hypothetical protein
MHATTVNMHQSNLKSRILDDLNTDQHYLQVKEILHKGYVQHKIKEYGIKEDELFMHNNRIYVPSFKELGNLVLKEIHDVVHLGYQKMIIAVRRQFLWLGMKKDVANYIA